MNLWQRFCNWLNDTPQQLPVYRKVVSRERVFDGEIITLECHHRIHLRTHPREEFSCLKCGKEQASRP